MKTKALVLIDIQNDYFPGGGLELVGPEAAAAAAARALSAARAAGLLVVHVRHENQDPRSTRFRPGSDGAGIRDAVAPLPGELVITKRRVDSFAGTGLEAALRAAGVEEIAVAGMMTHMCVDAFLRAATARDFGCSLLVAAQGARQKLDHQGDAITLVAGHRRQAGFGWIETSIGCRLSIRSNQPVRRDRFASLLPRTRRNRTLPPGPVAKPRG